MARRKTKFDNNVITMKNNIYNIVMFKSLKYIFAFSLFVIVKLFVLIIS